MAGNKKYDFFISYRRANNGSVCGNYVAGLLRGYSVFYDVSTITEGQFAKQIRDALQNTDRFILIVTEGAFSRPENPGKRDWYYEEISIAIETVGLDKITPVIFSGTLSEDILPNSLKGRGLCGCQKVPYVPEYAEFFETKFYKHFHISPQNKMGIVRGRYVAPPTREQVDDDTEIDAIENEDIIPFNVGGVAFNMVFVEGGTFKMGATPEQGDDADDNEKPVHTVTLSDYYIGETQVTQGLWQAVMGNNPSYFKKGDNYPVEQVSWNDAQDFIEKLNVKTCMPFCLPTEAEWEFAARGGNEGNGFRYSGGNDLDKVAVYEQNADSLGSDNPAYGTHPVKTKDCNELGIYDMSGNVWEWCQDRYADYSNRPATDPQGDSSNPAHVLRGGSWHGVASYCRVSSRQYNNPDFCNYNLGFRLGLVIAPF